MIRLYSYAICSRAYELKNCVLCHFFGVKSYLSVILIFNYEKKKIAPFHWGIAGVIIICNGVAQERGHYAWNLKKNVRRGILRLRGLAFLSKRIRLTLHELKYRCRVQLSAL